MNNAVGYARPTRFTNPVALGTDGIGADMLDEFRVAYVRHREDDVAASPESAWSWLATNHALFPDALFDRVLWDYEPMDPWRLAFTTGVGPREVRIDDVLVYADGAPTRVDAAEIRAKAGDRQRLFAKLERKERLALYLQDAAHDHRGDLVARTRRSAPSKRVEADSRSCERPASHGPFAANTRADHDRLRLPRVVAQPARLASMFSRSTPRHGRILAVSALVGSAAARRIDRAKPLGDAQVVTSCAACGQRERQFDGGTCTSTASSSTTCTGGRPKEVRIHRGDGMKMDGREIADGWCSTTSSHRLQLAGARRARRRAERGASVMTSTDRSRRLLGPRRQGDRAGHGAHMVKHYWPAAHI